MPFKKTWLVKDAKTKRTIWVQGTTFRVGPWPKVTVEYAGKANTYHPGHKLTIDDGPADRRAERLKAFEKKMGRPLVAVPGPEVEYLPVW